MTQFDPAREIVRDAVQSRGFPAAVIEVGTAHEVIWREAFGRLSYDGEAQATNVDTLFDLASLTKVIATTTLVMYLVDAGRVRLDDQVGHHSPGWRGVPREQATIRDLLAHASGLTAHLPLYRDHTGRQEFEAAICQLPLEYAPRSQSIYSDFGFILLGFIVEDLGGGSLADQFAALAGRLSLDDVRYNPPRAWRGRTAPTAISDWRGRLLCGDVHDDNAWALGGAAGHTGLFGSAASVGRFAQYVLRGLGGDATLAQPATLRTFVTRTEVPGSSRALGWDTMLPTSSCGHRMSASAIGHTGFTGTSLWIDPDRGVYIVLLTNRLYPSATHDAIQAIRPALHDALIDAVEA